MPNIKQLKDQLKSFLDKLRDRPDRDPSGVAELSRRADFQHRCRQIKQPIISNGLDGFCKPHHMRLVAYVRSGHESMASEQEKVLTAIPHSTGP